MMNVQKCYTQAIRKNGTVPVANPRIDSSGKVRFFSARMNCHYEDRATELSRIFSVLYVKAAKNWGQPWHRWFCMKPVASTCAEGSPHFLLILHDYFEPWRRWFRMKPVAYTCAEGSPHFLLILHDYFVKNKEQRNECTLPTSTQS